ncbi:6-carboxytetrahydropterin synthase [uncultured Fluviicola sp.]|uniref:6-pyruvoyl trahydropterin synthase family protein n=1 Tax=uncultured Fluviicola sp. TaxID=463303 RepID=UPI0025DDD4D5|nr:6-carboxytetrahydropterin synthase [uncultured Fluviicola sp.]
MKIFRVEQFNAAHRLFNPKWDDETNNRVFGKCNNPNFHGHNYKLEVELDGPINPETGYVMDMKHLSDIMKLEILERFDHRNLNLDCPEFKDLIPSAENIAWVCWNILREKLPSELKLKVRLWETPRNGVEYDGN